VLYQQLVLENIGQRCEKTGGFTRFGGFFSLFVKIDYVEA
jgi:hypothetical protein